MKKNTIQNNIEQLFFTIAPIYWLPMADLSGLSLLYVVKTFLLFMMVLFLLKDLFITDHTIKITKTDTILFVFLTINFFYYIFTKTNLDVLIMTILFIFFYRQGFNTRYKNFKISNYYIYFYIIIYLNIIAANFIGVLDFKTPIYLSKSIHDYFEYMQVVPTLSSTGYGLGRTSWAFSILLYTCYVFMQLDFSKKKNINLAKIYILLMFLSQLITGSKFGILISAGLLLYIYRRSFLKTYMHILSWSLTIIGAITYTFVHSAEFRLSEGSITTGRYDAWLLAPQIIAEKFPFGWAAFPNEDYDLFKYGLDGHHIHNAWLHFFAEYGVVGIISGLLLLALLISYLKLKNKKLIWPYLGIFIGIINSMVEPGSILSYAYHVFVFWYFLGVIKANKLKNYKNNVKGKQL